MDEREKRNIRECLVYAVVLTVKDRNVRRRLVSEFFKSLNRRLLIWNYEAKEQIDQAYKQMENLEGFEELPLFTFNQT